jgi:hypothetical protein
LLSISVFRSFVLLLGRSLVCPLFPFPLLAPHPPLALVVRPTKPSATAPRSNTKFSIATQVCVCCCLRCIALLAPRQTRAAASLPRCTPHPQREACATNTREHVTPAMPCSRTCQHTSPQIHARTLEY